MKGFYQEAEAEQRNKVWKDPFKSFCYPLQSCLVWGTIDSRGAASTDFLLHPMDAELLFMSSSQKGFPLSKKMREVVVLSPPAS